MRVNVCGEAPALGLLRNPALLGCMRRYVILSVCTTIQTIVIEEFVIKSS